MSDKIFRSDSIAARQVVPDKRERQNGDSVLELNPNRKWTQWGMALITNVFPGKTVWSGRCASRPRMATTTAYSISFVSLPEEKNLAERNSKNTA